MVNLDRMDLLEEKLKLLKGGTYSAVRTVAMAVIAVGTLKSALSPELKAVAIGALVFAYVVLMSVIEALTTIASLQNAAIDVAHLSMISLEARRIAPEDTRGALQIQTEIEAQERKTTEYQVQRGCLTDAASWHAVQSGVAIAALAGVIVVVWVSWEPAIRSLESLAGRLP